MTTEEVDNMGRISQNLLCSHSQFFLFCYFDLDLTFIIIIIAENKKSSNAHSTWLLSQMLGSSLCFQISEEPFQRHEVPGPGAGSHK